MKKLALLLGCLLLAVIAFDQLHSGTIRVNNVGLENNAQGDNGLPTALPFSYLNYPPLKPIHVLYSFNIPFHSSWLDDLSPIHAHADDFISTLSIDEKPATSLGSNTANDITIGHVDNKIRITITDLGGFAKLTLIRDPIFSNGQTFLMGMLALYLLFAGLCASPRRFPYGYEALLVTLFFYTTLPMHGWIYHEWLTLIATGPAIFALLMLGRNWAPAFPIHQKIDMILLRIAIISPRVWIWGVSLLMLVAASILAHVLYDTLPHIADSHTQYVMAKIFAEGRLTDISHPLKKFFDFQFMANDGKYYGQYFPGHAALLAIGMLMHMPWIINPLFGALSVAMVYFLGREIAGKNAGMIASLLMLLSPQVLFMSAEYMSHDTCMFFLTAFVYCYIRMLNTDRHRYAILAGACIGFACVLRAQTAFPFGLAIATHATIRLIKPPRISMQNLLLMACAFLPFLLFLPYYNMQTTGDPWLTPYEKVLPFQAQLLPQFFHASRWLSIGGDISRALSQLMSLHIEIMGWPCSPLLFILILYVTHKQPRHSNILIACFGASFLGLIFINPFGNNVIPGRYLYECTGILMVLVASGICCVSRMANSRSSMALLLAILTLWAWPYRIRESYETYAYNFYEGDPELYRGILDKTDKPALVFIHNYLQYRTLFFNEPPRDNEPVIFAQDLGSENQKLMDYYKNRHVYLVEGEFIRQLR